MRPRELTLQGFRSYRERTTFDLRDRRLIGVVGPIGSGKSSLLDAISFALFARTPTFERDTRSLIHQLDDAAHVELVFEVDGQIWRVQRGLRRKGASGHKLERLAADEPEAKVLESIQQEKAVRRQVERLLGMGFDAFRRSVLLAQNRFAEFLQASPVKRDEVLKGAFGYERFDVAHDVAKDRVRDAEAELLILEAEGGRLRQAAEERPAVVAAVASAAERRDLVEDAAPRIEQATASRVTAERAAEEAEERTRALVSLGATLPGGDELERVLRAAEDGDRAVSELQELADRAADEAERAAAELAAIAERVGDRTAFTAFTELVARLEHEGAEAERRTTELQEAAAAVDQAASAVAGAERAGGAATTVAERAAKALARSSERVVSRDDSLHRARHAAAAGDLRRHLAEGSPCPVCDQIVATVPKAAAPAKVAAAETALATARSAEAEARAAWEAAQRDAATAAERAAQVVAARDQADATLATATAAARSAEAAVTATRSELVDRLGEGDPRALLQARQAELDDAERLAKELATTHARARDAVDAARREDADASKAVATLATRVAGTWGALQRPRDISADPAGVRLAFIELGEELLAQHHEAEADLLKAREQIGADVATVTAELDALGLPADADLARERSAVAAAVSAAEERLRALDDELAAGADLTARIVVATARRDLSRRLASDLQPSRFLAYLLAEERAALAELGSVHLEELTGGAYRFTDDDAFRIIDVNAGGAERPAESLSGGETFLASLALALALAEMVTRGGGRLDSFFLDEGFGSLDPEHLDRAMEGIGRLVAGDAHRLVVLVSHVELMRQLLEDLIVLDKDERTGDTRVVAGASLRD